MNTTDDSYSQSLPSPDEQPPIELDPEFETELFRRLDEIDSGRAKMLSLDEVMTRLRHSNDK